CVRNQFDISSVRRDFPILNERVNGKPLVWLDNAATTQKPQSVIDRISDFYRHENSNIHRAAHELAARATDAYEGAREKSRRFLNASSTREIIFEEYEKLLGPRTRIVSFSQVSNALGTITPAREMVEIAHRYGARVVVDGAQAVSHMPVDVQTLDCDFYVFSGHKVFGPTGIGVVYGKLDVLDAMPPWQGGGNMIADVTFEKTAYQPSPARFEAGPGNIADAVGLGSAIDYVSE